ncbi:hypothetical protein R2103_10865 [Nitrosomonas sp. Is24]|uniref:hypothetical protein n=1 Tax=Nitrosomonas sp. Is24 TaxID=3080533 RepID=UPI00294AC576|nr:hypothetical protein [Nitrosomonas sp. Is24]MDV6342265.1 hypothetical protein [Nitrosomonas sp. Is24]
MTIYTKLFTPPSASNYLTPRKGLLSLDTLTDLTYHFRNVFLSSVVIGLFVFGTMSLFSGMMLLIEEYQHQSIAGIELSQIALILDLAFGFFATAIVWFRLPLVAGVLKNQPNETLSDKKFTVKIIAILATIFSICLGMWGTQITANAPLLWGIILSSTYACAASIGIDFAKHCKQKIDAKVNWVWLHWCAVLGAIPILALGYVLPHLPGWIHEILFGIGIAEKQSHSVWFLAGIISPIVCLLLALAISIHLGITGRAISSEAYFWVSRVAAKMAQYSLIFALPAVLFLFFPPLLDWTEAIFTVGGIFALFAIIVRWLAASTTTGSNKNKQADWKEKLTEGIVSIAPFILVFALLGFVSLGVRTAFENDSPPKSFTENLKKFQLTCHENSTPVTELLVHQLLVPQENAKAITFKTLRDGLQGYYYFETVNCIPSFKDYFQLNILALNSISLSAPFVWGLFATAIAIFLALQINANLFSMHTFYRNRLTNAYLAASNKTDTNGASIIRDADIGVHATDAINLKDLIDIKPYLIVNTTLNLAGENNDLAWQDRKAASFIMSPLYCGYALDGTRNPSEECFQKTESYASKNRAAYEEEKENPPNEYFLKLDLAMTISGAASSPLGGFHTKPGVSMLMVLGGARLGWWLSNPLKEEWWQGQDKRWQFSSDTPLLTTLYKEMSSDANEKEKKIYLSDGGHFENLGIYELVRRRCALIVVSDAGEDHLFNFDDLANAIHKIRVDFGVEIEIDVSELRPKKIPGDDGSEKFSAKSRFSSKNFVIGKIKYASSAKTEFKNEKDGILIYMKLSFPVSAESRAIDVLNYAALNNQFPHESTLDQWFSEEQFEAYRQIGYLIGEDAAQLIDAKLIEMT